MVNTRSISQNQGRTRISLCLCDCLNGLSIISTHGNLSYIYIAVGHCNACKVFLLGLFTASCELSNCTGLCGLGILTAGVGVNLGIEYHNVDILARCQNVVYAAEADIVSPSVTTEDPLRLLSQECLVSNNVLAGRAVDAFQSCNQLVSSNAV